MATIQTRKTARGRRYCALVRRAGFPPISRTFKRKRDALAWSEGVEADMAAGRYRIAPSITLADLIDRYIGSVCSTKKSGERQAQQLREWRALIGQVRVDRLRPADIAEARDQIAHERGPATVVRYLAALSHVFTVAAKDWQIVETNPARTIIWPKEPRGRVRFLGDDELVRLREACRRSKAAELADLVELALMTGCRRGELLGLDWSQVDLDHRWLILENTKNNERRQIPLNPSAMAVIKSLQRGRRNGPVFTLSDDQVQHAWRKALKAARIENFRFHDLRHTAASNLAKSGATTQQIAAVLGHKTLSMVVRYAHLTTSDARKALENMDNYLKR